MSLGSKEQPDLIGGTGGISRAPTGVLPCGTWLWVALNSSRSVWSGADKDGSVGITRANVYWVFTACQELSAFCVLHHLILTTSLE